MTRKIDGPLEVGDARFGVVVSRFNETVTAKLLEGALKCLEQHGAGMDRLPVAWVPGAWELPLVADRMIAAEKLDALVALGCLIRGETPHFDVLATEVARGLGEVSLRRGVPVAFGVLTTENLAQALDRAGPKLGNKGWEAALSAIESRAVCARLGG